MDFFKFIQSLDELIYEAVSLLLFYPLTLLRILRAPLQTMKLVEQELSDTDRKQFTRFVPPPLFLLLTLIIVHSVELGTVGESDLVLSDRGFRGLIDDDTSLIIFRILMISILPLAAATRLVMARGEPVDKLALKAPFYSQCYVASVFALLFGIAGTFIEQPSYPVELAAGLTVAAVAWLLVVETRWFAFELGTGLWRGVGQAMLMLAQWSLALAIIMFAMS